MLAPPASRQRAGTRWHGDTASWDQPHLQSGYCGPRDTHSHVNYYIITKVITTVLSTCTELFHWQDPFISIVTPMSLGSWSRTGGSAPLPHRPDSGPQGPACFYHGQLQPLVGCAVPFAGRLHAPMMAPALEGGAIRGPWGCRDPQRTVNNCSCLWEGQAAPELLWADGHLSYFFFLNIHQKCHHLLRQANVSDDLIGQIGNSDSTIYRGGRQPEEMGRISSTPTF